MPSVALKNNWQEVHLATEDTENTETKSAAEEPSMPGEHLDISSDGPEPPGESGDATNRQRRFVGIHFACCGVYSRIPLNRSETAYSGYCPRCLKRIEIKIGPGGTDARFFTAH